MKTAKGKEPQKEPLSREHPVRVADELPKPEGKGFFPSLDRVLIRLKSFRELIVGLAGAVAFVYGYVGNTSTSFDVVGASPDGESIILKVSSKGPILKRSTIIGYQLTFPDVPIEDASVEFTQGDENKAVVTPLSSTTIHLAVAGLRSKCRVPQVDGLPDRYEKNEIESLLRRGRATLTMTVRESNDKERAITKPFHATDIKPFILRHLPDHMPERTTCS